MRFRHLLRIESRRALRSRGELRCGETNQRLAVERERISAWWAVIGSKHRKER